MIGDILLLLLVVVVSCCICSAVIVYIIDPLVARLCGRWARRGTD